MPLSQSDPSYEHCNGKSSPVCKNILDSLLYLLVLEDFWRNSRKPTRGLNQAIAFPGYLAAQTDSDKDVWVSGQQYGITRTKILD